jgi:hypothetical protein
MRADRSTKIAPKYLEDPAVIKRHGLVWIVEALGSRPAHGVSGFRAFTITDVAM